MASGKAARSLRLSRTSTSLEHTVAGGQQHLLRSHSVEVAPAAANSQRSTSAARSRLLLASASSCQVATEPTLASSKDNLTASVPESQGVLASLRAAFLSTAAAASSSTTSDWSVLVTVPQFIMISSLQSFFGGRGGQKPSIQPNEYMDALINNMKVAMKDRDMHELALPDQDVGVTLYNGQLSGLTNLSRRGDALLEAANDHLLLSFALQAKDVRAAYGWRKQRLKGHVAASVQRVIMNLKIKQMLPTSIPPELIDLRVEEVAGLQVSLHGLGPLNWVGRRAIRAVLRRRLRDYLEKECRDMIATELQNVSAEDTGLLSAATFGLLS